MVHWLLCLWQTQYWTVQCNIFHHFVFIYITVHIPLATTVLSDPPEFCHLPRLPNSSGFWVLTCTASVPISPPYMFQKKRNLHLLAPWILELVRVAINERKKHKKSYQLLYIIYAVHKTYFSFQYIEVQNHSLCLYIKMITYFIMINNTVLNAQIIASYLPPLFSR